jgi:hypothetical protein
MTREQAHDRAKQLYLRIMNDVSFGRGIDAPIKMIADELLMVEAEARADARHRVAKGPDYELSLCMVNSPGYEGWANLILDCSRFETGLIAMLPPPIAEVLKEHIPLMAPPSARNGKPS